MVPIERSPHGWSKPEGLEVHPEIYLPGPPLASSPNCARRSKIGLILPWSNVSVTSTCLFCLFFQGKKLAGNSNSLFQCDIPVEDTLRYLKFNPSSSVQFTISPIRLFEYYHNHHRGQFADAQPC